MQKIDVYVVKADSKQVRVNTINNTADSELLKLGFSFDAGLSSYVKDTAGAPETSIGVSNFFFIFGANKFLSLKIILCCRSYRTGNVNRAI
ncbi:hypothetical protein TDB9533_00496 [Thalassocella blandensis]|nr:hypothetical protein TDB9533_00496 [Thalassocella blandensis]